MTNILLILLGPLVSFLIIMGGKNNKFNPSYLLYVGIGAAIALVVSSIVHSSIRKSGKGNLISVITSELIYFLIVILASRSPEDKMWLPVVLFFLPIFSLPTALLVSIGIGGIMKKDKK